jgi:hypothetical protein
MKEMIRLLVFFEESLLVGYQILFNIFYFLVLGIYIKNSIREEIDKFQIRSNSQFL